LKELGAIIRAFERDISVEATYKEIISKRMGLKIFDANFLQQYMFFIIAYYEDLIG
jgi:hypothetical protein